MFDILCHMKHYNFLYLLHSMLFVAPHHLIIISSGNYLGKCLVFVSYIELLLIYFVVSSLYWGGVVFSSFSSLTLSISHVLNFNDKLFILYIKNEKGSSFRVIFLVFLKLCCKQACMYFLNVLFAYLLVGFGLMLRLLFSYTYIVILLKCIHHF